jgi:hypothetical protein
VIGGIPLDDVLSGASNQQPAARLDEVTELGESDQCEIRRSSCLKSGCHEPADVGRAHPPGGGDRSTGAREAAINVADGERQSAVLRAEGQKQAAFWAEAPRQSQLLRAEAASALGGSHSGPDRRPKTMTLQYFDTLARSAPPFHQIIFPGIPSMLGL